MTDWRLLAHGAADVLFPPVCVGCRGLVEEGSYRHLCARCAAALEFIRGPACPRCGHPDAAGRPPGPCGAPCVRVEPDFGRARCAVWLRGPARDLLLELKYRGSRHVLEDIAEIFRRSPEVLDHVRGAVLIPVPLHARKQRERGFNQSVLLAQLLAQVSGGRTVVRPLLRRVVDTPTQTGFDQESRGLNLKNAFALPAGVVLTSRLRYLLVDDVFTTGSTLNSCARVLRSAGGGPLDVVTFGRG
jgi:ComF family protein